MTHFRFAGGGFKKYFSTPSDDAFNGNPKNQIALKKCESASGVAACVLVSEWSIGYSSIGEVLVHRLPVPLFSQNVRQKTPIKAGNFRMISFALCVLCVDLPLALVFFIIESCSDQFDCICDA